MAVDPLSFDFGREKPFCVYIYFDPRPRKKRAPIYVGKGRTKTRPDEHWKRRTKNHLLQDVLSKLRAAGLSPIIEFVGFFDDNEHAVALERTLIARFGRRNNGTGKLCNLTDGGEGNVGWKITDETRERLRQSHRGKKATPEQRAKQSEALRRRWQDDQQRQKLLYHPGHSMETMARLRIAALRRDPPSAELIAKGNAGNRGRHQSQEERARRSQSQLRQYANADEESRQDRIIQLNSARAKRKFGHETRAKMGAATREANKRPEVIQRRSAAAKRAWARKREADR